MSFALSDKIDTLKGIGPKKAELFAHMGIKNAEDLLLYYPRDYEDRRVLRAISSVKAGETVLIRGKIQLILQRGFRRKTTVQLLISDASGSIRIVFFNMPYLARSLSKEKIYEFYGLVRENGDTLEMVHPQWNEASSESESDGILPIYPLTEGISNGDIRKCMKQVLPYASLLADYMPIDIQKGNNMCGLSYAIENIHFPTDGRRLGEARYRLVFDELFLLQTGLYWIRSKNHKTEGAIAFSKDARMDDFVPVLGFPLTNAQKRVLAEVECDMEASLPMNRLVQGDVGSGKTAIAAAAMFKAVKSGFQAVLMAPTEILAKQHFEGLKPLFERFGICTEFLSGHSNAKERNRVLQALSGGEINVLIGTHAVIQDTVNYAKLGLVITDEQHRFGVRERSKLIRKGQNPDVLVMTATPIPRTLAAILYGDLDISVIDEMPPGRKPIRTLSFTKKERKLAYARLFDELNDGRQAYIVCPLIEDSEEVDAHSAEAVYEKLCSYVPNLSDKGCIINVEEIALLHGQLSQNEKDAIMDRFQTGKIRILVSTVVIEVGINVPNATVMLIENAERFGLAQLHQLRGRVGRGSHQSYCFLIHENPSEVSTERVNILCESQDGFLISEKDLELRGPGEFFGLRQHGLPELHLADLSRHKNVLESVRKASNKLLHEDPGLERPEHALLRAKIQKNLDSLWEPGQ